VAQSVEVAIVNRVGVPGASAASLAAGGQTEGEPRSKPGDLMLGGMAGRSLAMQHLFARMRYTAPHFRLAALEGEAGSGKLLTAQTLHQLGPSANGPFIPAMAADFLRHGAALWRDGRGGLLYLARVDELGPEQQLQLRETLERAAHERIRTHVIAGPLQLVAGSSQPLRRLAAAGAFRPDLATHLTAIRFALPSLRERREDIPLLAHLFLRRWGREHGKELRGFAPDVMRRLTTHSWPGNVRELEVVITSAALECPGEWIRLIDLPALACPAAASNPAPAALPLEEIEVDPNLDRAILRHITRVMAQASGNKVRAARMLGISRSTLYRLLENSRAPAGGEEPEQA
jgi:DNA-binding NtrC family response regulator